MLLMLPISYIALKVGAEPEIVFVVQLVVTFAAQIVMLFIIRPLIQLSLREYFTEVFFKPGLVSILAVIPAYITYHFLPVNILTLFVVCVVSVIFTALFVYFLGLNRSEKEMAIAYVKPLIKKINN